MQDILKKEMINFAKLEASIVRPDEVRKVQDQAQPESFCFGDLGGYLINYNKAKFKIGDFVLLLQGIPEDFRIFLDNVQVCEVVYDQTYNENVELCRKVVELIS